jgi:hypothetical protein
MISHIQAFNGWSKRMLGQIHVIAAATDLFVADRVSCSRHHVELTSSCPAPRHLLLAKSMHARGDHTRLEPCQIPFPSGSWARR